MKIYFDVQPKEGAYKKSPYIWKDKNFLSVGIFRWSITVDWGNLGYYDWILLTYVAQGIIWLVIIIIMIFLMFHV